MLKFNILCEFFFLNVRGEGEVSKEKSCEFFFLNVRGEGEVSKEKSCVEKKFSLERE